MAATAVLSAALIVGAGEQVINTGITIVNGDVNVMMENSDNNVLLGAAYAGRGGGSPDGDCGCDGPAAEGGGNDRTRPTLSCTRSRQDDGTVRVQGIFNGGDRYSFSLTSPTHTVPAGVRFTTTISGKANLINRIGNAGSNAGQAILNATVLEHCLPDGVVTQQPPAQSITVPAPSRSTPAQPRRTTPVPLANKNVVMVVADMVARNAEMQVSTSFCDGNDPYEGQSVIGTYSADSFDKFYQGREGVRERRGSSQLDLLTYNTDGNTALFNGIEDRAIKTPIETRAVYDNDTWDVADVNENVPMAGDLPRMSDYEQELVSRGLMAALVHLDHLDNEQTNGVYRVYATLGQDILADDAQTVLFAEGSPAYLAEQGGVDLGEVSVNAPMFVNPEDATNARFTDEQEADMAAIQFAQGNMARAMEIDPNGFTAPEGNCSCAQTAAAEMSTTDGAVVTNLPVQQSNQAGLFGGGLLGLFGLAALGYVNREKFGFGKKSSKGPKTYQP